MMKRETFEKLLATWHEAQVTLSRSKGHDYAGEDILGNFKRMHKICSVWDIQPGERAEDVFLYYVLTKIDRLCNLLHSKKTPQNESVQDTMRDVLLYLTLLRAYLEETDCQSN